MPQPNHLIESSPGKWQTIWRVHGFELPQAEDLLRRMVREFGADPAAVDSARVLRLPGFYNHKYDRPHLVTVETLSSNVYTPAQFPHFTLTETVEQSPGSPRTRRPHSAITQSERDWAFAKRALGRGDDPQDIIQSIAAYRTDKPNPQYYAQHTVEKARAAIEQERRAAVQKTTSPGKPREGLSFGLG